MMIKHLEITNFRTFKHAEFNFEPGMNLIVGINGVGKTTVLDALRFCMLKMYPKLTAAKEQLSMLRTSDYTNNTSMSMIKCVFNFKNEDVKFVRYRNRIDLEKSRNKKVHGGREFDRTEETSLPKTYTYESLKNSTRQPIGLFFSIKRSLPMHGLFLTTRQTTKGPGRAFDQAFNDRFLQLGDFAQWMITQEKLGKEDPTAKRHVKSLCIAAERFMPGFSNLHAVSQPKPSLFINKLGTTLNVLQLSDGERGMLALVLEIAKRLSQANPTMRDPLKNGKGIVLIDEIDLHLHPKWQRTVVHQLTETFPKIQFIATTHSPQVISEVKPEQVILMPPSSKLPGRSYGLDSNSILRKIFDTEERPFLASEAIHMVDKLINKVEFSKARKKIKIYQQMGLDLPEWAIFETRMTRMEKYADEIHPKKRPTR
ncbi:MAG: AAA family ATPase [Candidatus Wallbacteria bacterium]|nr:AAA family ATPase [Candidatus Wallbacteria bacterium]